MAANVPQSVTRMQAMIAMNNAGLLPTIQNWVAGQNTTIQLEWANAGSFSRSSPLINSAAATLGITQAQLDNLFIAAAQITNP